MLSNVVTVDHEAMRITLQKDRGCLILFDFKAAFPSVEREFMMETIQRLGMPADELNFVFSLYDFTTATIQLGGSMGRTFEMTRGIRQGCPLSPILFAATADILLRRLTRTLGGRGMCRAFADDTAAAIENFQDEIENVAKNFTEFAKISGLDLNLGKTIIIPLWLQEEDTPRTSGQGRGEDSRYGNIQTKLDSIGGGWEKVQIKGQAKYLGFMVGPERNEEAWNKAEEKWKKRVRSWAGREVGLQYSALLYNTFCSSVLGFLGQLLEIPGSILAQEESMMLEMASGPYEWTNAVDLWHMGGKFGISRSFDCIQAKAQAAKLRAITFEAWEKPIRSVQIELRSYMRGSDFDNRMIRWRVWFKNAFANILCKNEDNMKAKGIDQHSIKNELKKGEDDIEYEKLRRCFQKKATEMNLQHFGCHWEDRIKHKLKRWKLPGIGGWRALAYQRNMAGIRNLVAPRVAAAVWSLAWNRWCTARRFQKCGQCLLGCDDWPDSAEHYMGCKVARKVGWNLLKLPSDSSYEDRKLEWLAATEASSPETKTAYYLLVYSVFMTTNRRRACGEKGGEEEELKQWVRRGVEGHQRSTKVLSRRWAETRG